jgi:hypothetical protein
MGAFKTACPFPAGLGSCVDILPWLTAAKTGKATNVMMAGGFAQVATIAEVALNLQNFTQELECYQHAEIKEFLVTRSLQKGK